MTLKDIKELLDAEVVCGKSHLDIEIKFAGGSDMMSDVLAFGQPGLLLLTGTVGVGPVAPWVVTVIAVLMLCNAAVMGLLAWWSLRGRAIVDNVAVVVVVLNIAAAFTDEIGIPDLAYLALSLALLVSLLWSMRAVRVTQTKRCVH